MKNIKLIQIAIFLILTPFLLKSQNVAINNNGASPDASAILDMTSTTDGLLIPRMSLAQRNAITNPATALMIYQNSGTTGFYYNSGTPGTPVWTQIGGGGGSGWGLTGNAGTSAVTNFVGTTDNNALVFRTNSVIRTRITTKGQIEVLNTGGSVFIGEGSGANDDLNNRYNVYIGYQAGNSKTTGYENVAIGYHALRLGATAYRNTAIGYRVLYNNTGYFNFSNGYESSFYQTSGNHNISMGSYALHYNQTGDRNVAIGHQALYSSNGNSTDDNTAIGYNALRVTRGDDNTAIGSFAAYSNTTGYENVAIGFHAMYDNTTGYRNVAVGRYALYNCNNGIGNTAIGRNAFAASTNYSYSGAFGYASIVNDDNQYRIGRSTTGSIGGYQLWSNVSDKRFKVNVKEDVLGLEFITKLRPVTYNLDIDALDDFLKVPDSLRNDKLSLKAKKLKENTIETGFIAQEVEEAAKECGFKFSGVDAPTNEESHYGLRYASFVVPLVKAVQEQQEIINELKNQNKELIKRVEKLETK